MNPRRSGEFAVEIRDHIMVAHSLPREVFGPAQRLHGATYVVDVTFFRDELDADGVVVDIGLAKDRLRAVLAPLDYRNLDDQPDMQGAVTTTEFLSRYIFDRLAEALRGGGFGPGGVGVRRLRVTLGESHLARAWYEAALD